MEKLSVSVVLTKRQTPTTKSVCCHHPVFMSSLCLSDYFMKVCFLYVYILYFLKSRGKFFHFSNPVLEQNEQLILSNKSEFSDFV